MTQPKFIYNVKFVNQAERFFIFWGIFHKIFLIPRLGKVSIEIFYSSRLSSFLEDYLLINHFNLDNINYILTKVSIFFLL